jgi:hypothetical protein
MGIWHTDVVRDADFVKVNNYFFNFFHEMKNNYRNLNIHHKMESNKITSRRVILSTLIPKPYVMDKQ